MFGQDYYHGIIRKYIIMFGNMFNDIDIQRFNNSGTAVQNIRVPIAYGPREKFLARLHQDPSLTREIAIQLPRLSFEITNMTYAPDRTLNKLQKNTALGDNGSSLRSQFVPVPYDIEISLYGMFDNNEDAVQVVEQILPFFRPDWTNSVKLVPEMSEYIDIPTVLNGMSIEDSYDADFQTRRAIIYTFNFTVKGLIYGPVSKKGVIKRTILDFTAQDSNTAIGTVQGPQRRTTIQPGMYANGTPTANSSASIAITSINANNNWTYAFDDYDYFDGVNRHNHE